MNSRVAIVTGGAGGIGLATARELLNHNIRCLLLSGRTSGNLERAAENIMRERPDAVVECFAGNAADANVASGIVERAIDLFGGVDVLVNSAGGDDFPRLVTDINLWEIDGIIKRTLGVQLVMTRAVLPALRLRGGGAIVNVGSDAGKIPTPGESVIGAAMAGVAMFTRVIACEEKRHGIRANVVFPSITSGTALFDRVMADPFAGKLFRKAMSKAHLGVVKREEVAALIGFLASEAASKITGQVISITGGISSL